MSTAHFKTAEKKTKKGTKKVTNKNVTEICTFLMFLSYLKLILLFTFIVHFFETFSTDLQSA
jgi:hypothetical protein